jgi:tetratricopeptide (TPR) repeat protein
MQNENQRLDAEYFLKLGAQHMESSRFQAAELAFIQALEQYEQIADSEGMLMSLHNLGIAYLCLGEFDDAIMSYERALPLLERIGKTPAFSAQLLRNLGFAYYSKRDFQTALGALHSALHLFLQLGDQRGEAEVTFLTGISCHHLNFPDEAIVFFQKAIQIAQSLGDQDLEADFRETVDALSQ